MVDLFCFAIDAPKTCRVVMSAAGVVARLPEFQPAANGGSNTRGALAARGGEVDEYVRGEPAN
jgi:hypothetical protein